MSLSSDRNIDVDFYKKNGYFIARDFFEKSYVEGILKKFYSYLESDDFSERRLFNSLKRLTNTPEKYTNLLKAFAKSKYIYDLFLCDDIYDAILELGIKEPSFCTYPVTNLVSNDLILENRSNKSVGWPYHQDWPSIQGSLNSVMVWIPLNNVDENYPMQLLPGSHKRGLIPCIDAGNGFPEIPLDDDEARRLVAPAVKCGDVLFFSGFTVHGTRSAENTNDSFRFAVTGRFDDMLDKFFSDNGYYCAYKRSVDREIYNLPSKNDIIISNGW